MTVATLIAFAVAFLVFAASPGPDNLTIVARTITRGAIHGIAYGAGTVAGILVFLMLAAFGLSVVAAETGWLMALLRYGGAGYLVLMGVRLWIAVPPDVGRADVEAEVDADDGRAGEGLAAHGKAKQGDTMADARRGVIGGFLTGMALNLGNPKMPLFYLALLPNVVGPDLGWMQVGILSLIIVAIEALVIGGHVLAAGRARRVLSSPAVLRKVNRVAGGLMVGAGVAVAAR
jgi:threonine/homoserine/homoserine lactone efflux protein